MSVNCELEFGDMENDSGDVVEGVSATCSRCGHTTESFGTGMRSIRRCLVLMRDECPYNEENFYTCPETENKS